MSKKTMTTIRMVLSEMSVQKYNRIYFKNNIFTICRLFEEQYIHSFITYAITIKYRKK